MDILNGYRNNHQDLSTDESENSDNECAVWKRAEKKTNISEVPMIAEAVESAPISTEKPKRKKNTVWSDILQDQLISEDLSSCLLKNKPANYGSRGHESYDYTLKYADSEISTDCDVNMSEETSCESKPKFPHYNKHKKFYLKLDKTERATAFKINKILREKKFYLIGKY